MMAASPGWEVIDACRLLFPAAFMVDSGFLNTLADEDLKKAFRKKALSTHPDRSVVLGRSREELSRKFQELSSAYQTLLTFFSRRSSDGFRTHSHQRPGHRASSVNAGRAAADDYFYKGRVPWRELRLGGNMYYSKIISWRTLIGAIVWQRKQRPLFGEIARQWNFISDDDIRLILKSKTPREMFGECARRYGFLSEFQQMAVTGRQRQIQPLFGKHFIESGLLSSFQVETMVKRKENHNFRIRCH